MGRRIEPVCGLTELFLVPASAPQWYNKGRDIFYVLCAYKRTLTANRKE